MEGLFALQTYPTHTEPIAELMFSGLAFCETPPKDLRAILPPNRHDHPTSDSRSNHGPRPSPSLHFTTPSRSRRVTTPWEEGGAGIPLSQDWSCTIFLPRLTAPPIG